MDLAMSRHSVTFLKAVSVEAWLKCIKLEAVDHDNEPELEKFQKEITHYWLDIKIQAKPNQTNKQKKLQITKKE